MVTVLLLAVLRMQHSAHWPLATTALRAPDGSLQLRTALEHGAHCSRASRAAGHEDVPPLAPACAPRQSSTFLRRPAVERPPAPAPAPARSACARAKRSTPPVRRRGGGGPLASGTSARGWVYVSSKKGGSLAPAFPPHRCRRGHQACTRCSRSQECLSPPPRKRAQESYGVPKRPCLATRRLLCACESTTRTWQRVEEAAVAPAFKRIPEFGAKYMNPTRSTTVVTISLKSTGCIHTLCSATIHSMTLGTWTPPHPTPRSIRSDSASRAQGGTSALSTLARRAGTP